MGERILYQIRRADNVSVDEWQKIREKVLAESDQIECDDEEYLVFEGWRGAGFSVEECMAQIVDGTAYKKCSFTATYLDQHPDEEWCY